MSAGVKPEFLLAEANQKLRHSGMRQMAQARNP
jgi:hypothetical protein